MAEFSPEKTFRRSGKASACQLEHGFVPTLGARVSPKIFFTFPRNVGNDYKFIDKFFIRSNKIALDSTSNVFVIFSRNAGNDYKFNIHKFFVSLK